MSRATAAGALFVLSALLAGCSAAAGVRPSSYPDVDVPCPGGLVTWNLKVTDRRARPEAGERVIAAVRDAIQKSFPGCRWSSEDGVPTIEIEIHRFESVREGDVWDATVQWTVTAQNATGRTLLAFEADETVSRPNYRGSDNEKESLTEAYRAAVERTARGLRTVRASDSSRPRWGTHDALRGHPANGGVAG
ncbi:MAG: hypothetical protein WAU32_02495 [Thermoanaerobaculia bacterium]|jgi:hypothetical protein